MKKYLKQRQFLGLKILLSFLLISTPFVGQSSIPKNSKLSESLYAPSPSSKKNLSEDKEELWGMIKEGELRVSSVIYMEEAKPVCYINTYNNRELIPAFAQVADSPSSIVFKEGFPECGDSIKQKMAFSSQGFVPEGAKFAATPVVALGVATLATVIGVSCVAGVLSKVIPTMVWDEESSDFRTRRFGTSLIGAVGVGTYSALTAGSKTTLLGALGMSLFAGVLPYFTCGTSYVYLVE